MENNYRYLIQEEGTHRTIADFSYSSPTFLSLKDILKHLKEISPNALTPYTFYSVSVYKNGIFDRDCIFSTGAEADVDLNDDCFYPYEYIIFNLRTGNFVDTIYAQKPLNPKEVRKQMKKADVRKNCPYKVRMYINGFYEKEFKFRTNKNANVRY